MTEEMTQEETKNSDKDSKPVKPADRPGKNNNNRNRLTGIILFLIILTIGGFAGYYYWNYLSTHITTDDAYVRGHIYMISSRVKGTVREIYVKDNAKVKKDDLLVKLDPDEYTVKVEKAKASLAVASQEINRRYAAVATAKSRLELSKAKLELAKIELERQKTLFEKAIVAREKYDLASTNYNVAVAQVRANEDELKQALALVSIREKNADLKKAELDLEYTSIYSPADGYITRKSVEVGNRLSEGQPVFAVVTLKDTWIEANFKEIQVEKIKPGMKTEIEIDTFPGKKFKGHVESIMAGTGGAFAILPPENATGNWVKVVQRIPVKIIIDKGEDPNDILRVGMSCIITIPLPEKN
ncbi:MAG: Secretion protein HlyD family protein [Parcubacteria group bacterium GW2011_GWC2_38_7]|nr:MAG: Secretion protein HlyD family protein [Parcubacteria group bacterium GW2011_GWC2_38_7]